MKKYFILFVVVLVGFIQAQWVPLNIRLAGPAATAQNFLYGGNGMAILSTGSNYIFKSFDNGSVWMADWFKPTEKPRLFTMSGGGYIMSIESDLRSFTYSTDRGGLWTKVTTGLVTTDIVVEIEGSRGNLFYFVFSKGIYRKPPANNWLFKLTLPIAENETIKGLATFKSSGELFFATSTGRVIKSTDEGTGWNEVANFNSEISIIEVYSSSNVVLIGKRDLQRTIYSSSDKGVTWDSLAIPFNCLELHMTTPGRGFARSTTNELYYTTDSMKTWNKNPSIKIFRGCITSGEKGIVVSPTYEVFTTSNSGESWEQTSDLNTNLINDIEVFDDNSAYALTASGELHFSGNYGGTWNLVKDQLPSPLTKLTQESDTSLLIYSPGEKVLRFSGHFTDLTKNYPDFTSKIYKYENTLYVLNEKKNLSYSEDYGRTWTTKSIPATANVNFFFATITHLLIASDAGKFFWSSDRGNTWVEKKLGSWSTDAILFIYRNGYRMWACSKQSKMYYSDNGGLSWSNVGIKNTSKAFFGHKDMWVMQVSPTEIIQSSDEGYTWQVTKTIPAAIDVASLKVNTKRFGLVLDVNGYLYLMLRGGLPVEMTSFNAEVVPNGVLLRWETATETNNYGFFVQRKNNGIWSDIAMIPGRGTTLNPSAYSFLDELRPDKGDTNYYRLKQVDFSGEFSYSKEIAIGFTPYTLELDQNYPNPFSTGSDNGNSETVIRFRLPEDGETKLTVYDTQGRIVEELLNGSLPAGEHSFTFPSKVNSPASGVYFYELWFNGKIKRGKMLLLR